MGLSQWAPGFPLAYGVGGSHRLAEGEEGESEARTWRGSGRNTTLTRVVGLQTEAIDRRRGGSVGRVGRSLRQEPLSHAKS